MQRNIAQYTSQTPIVDVWFRPKAVKTGETKSANRSSVRDYHSIGTSTTKAINAKMATVAREKTVRPRQKQKQSSGGGFLVGIVIGLIILAIAMGFRGETAQASQSPQISAQPIVSK